VIFSVGGVVVERFFLAHLQSPESLIRFSGIQALDVLFSDVFYRFRVLSTLAPKEKAITLVFLSADWSLFTSFIHVLFKYYKE